MTASIQIGERVYLKLCVAGEPGCVMGFDRDGRALIEWPDMLEIGRLTAHAVDTLIVDEAFTVRQFDLFDFDAVAA